MYDYESGAYVFSEKKFKNENIYQMENCYYIKYNTKKALYALDKLCDNYNGEIQEKCFYYHVYLDLLFEAVGMIINRFKPQKKNGNIILQAENNCIEYNFSEEKYPLLNDKKFRNFIEHIDEKDETLIDNELYFGMFNLVYPNMDAKVKKELLDTEKQQNNLLNLEDMTYTILNSYNSEIKKKTINLNELKKELIEINKISENIWGYLTNGFCG